MKKLEIGDKPKSSASHGKILIFVQIYFLKYNLYNFNKLINIVTQIIQTYFAILGPYPNYCYGQTYMAPSSQETGTKGNNEQHFL